MTTRNTSKSYSAFGQLRWKIVPELELAAGARYTHDKKNMVLLVTQNNLATATGLNSLPEGVPLPVSYKGNNVSPDVTLTWKPSPDQTVYAGYKTGDGMDPVLYAQFPIVEELSSALGFQVYGMREFEADDALATAASQLELEPSVTRVVIASPDKDLCQCVARERVVTWDRIRERTFDEAGVMERLGVPPASVPDYLALVGDSADGFPGVPRWGEKSARALLARYGQLEHIPDSADDWDVSVRGARSLAESLARHRKDAELFRVLATLRRDVPLDASLEAIRWRAPERNELESVLGRYGASGDELQGLAALLLG